MVTRACCKCPCLLTEDNASLIQQLRKREVELGNELDALQVVIDEATSLQKSTISARDDILITIQKLSEGV